MDAPQQEMSKKATPNESDPTNVAPKVPLGSKVSQTPEDSVLEAIDEKTPPIVSS